MTTEEKYDYLNSIEKEVFKIFSIVTSEKEISAYKSMLLETKLNILSQNLAGLIVSSLEQDTITINKYLLKNKLILIGFIVALILIFINPVIGLGLNLFCWLYKFKLDKEDINVNDLIKNTNYLMERASKLDITFDNCHRFLNARTNLEIESREEELQDENLRKMEIANQTIEISLLGGTVDNVPDEIRNMMVMMLQDTLNTEETDFEKLIQMGTEKAMEETLNKNENMTRNLTKNDKFDEK